MKVLATDVPIVVTFFTVACKALLANICMDTRVTQGGLLTTAGLLLIVISFCVLLPLRYRKHFLFGANVLISLLLLAESLYFSYFQVPFSMYVLLQMSNLADLSGSIVHLVELKHSIFVLDILPVLYLFYFTENQSKTLGKKIFILLFAAGCMLLVIKPVYRVVFRNHVNVFRKLNPQTFVRHYGVLGNRVIDVFSFLSDRRIRLESAEIVKIETWFSARKPEKATLGRYHSFGKGKNIILVQFESLQNFVLNKTREGQEITPHLNRLLKNSIYFENIYPQTVEGNSSDAELITNASLFPLRRGSTFFRYPGVKYNSLGTILKQRGYHTIAVHADEGAYWNRYKVFPNLGFDRFVELNDFEQDDLIGMGLSDLSMFRQSVPLLKKIRQPFYAFYITLTSHMPFSIPDKEKKLNFSEELSLSYLGDYLQSINYADRALGYFIGELEEAGLLKNTLIVIYGDHAGMMEKDRPDIERFWSSTRMNDDEWLRSYATVPFIIFNPLIRGERLNKIGGQIDILPTIAHLMNLDTQVKYMLGTSLFRQDGGWALLPKGDYRRKALIITKNGEYLRNDSREHMLDISELMIRGNFFSRSHFMHPKEQPGDVLLRSGNPQPTAL